MPPEPDATTLHVRAALGGDPGSLGWVVQRLNPLLIETARFRLGTALQGECDPQDLVQDAWLVAMPRLTDLVARDGRWTPVLLQFLSKTILLSVNNLLRRKARRQTSTTGAIDTTSDQTGVVSQAVRSELQSEVRHALGELSANEREVLILRGVEQHGNRAVGELLGISEEAVSKRYRRALQHLRQRLPNSVFDELPD